MPNPYMDLENPYLDIPSSPEPEQPKDLKSLGAYTKPDQPGYTFFPSGVTHRATDNKFWLPSLKRWIPRSTEGGLIINPYDFPVADEATEATRAAHHFPPSEGYTNPGWKDAGAPEAITNNQINRNQNDVGAPNPIGNPPKQQNPYMVPIPSPTGLPMGAYPVMPGSPGSEAIGQLLDAPAQSGMTLARGLSGLNQATQSLVRNHPVASLAAKAMGAPLSISDFAQTGQPQLKDISNAATEYLGGHAPQTETGKWSQIGGQLGTFPAKMAAVGGVGAPALIFAEVAGNRYLDAKAKDVPEDKAIALAGAEGGLNALLLSGIPFMQAQGIVGRILKGAAIGSGMQAGNIAGTATYDKQAAMQMLTDPKEWARSIIPMIGAEAVMGHSAPRPGEERLAGEVKPEAPRAYESVIDELKGAIEKGDLEKAKALKVEADTLKPNEEIPTTEGAKPTEGMVSPAETPETKLAEETLPTGELDLEKQGIQYLGAGVDLKGMTAKALGLDEAASYPEIIRGVMDRIGKLGASAKETAIKILDKLPELGRKAADAIANHLHDVFGGTDKGQLGAIGEKPLDENAQRRRDAEEVTALAGLHGQDRADAIAKLMTPKPPEPVKKSAWQDATVYKMFKDLQGAFGAGVGKAGEEAKEDIREIASREAFENEKRNQVLKKLRRPFEKLPEDKQHELIDAYESGAKLVNYGAWNEGSEWARNMYDSLYKQGKEAGIDDWHYLENYLTIMAKNPDQVPAYLESVKRTMAGRAGFLEPRTFANHKAMREAGIEPKYTNLADIMAVSMADQERLLTAKRILNSLVAGGQVVATTPRDGMIELPSEITSKIAGKDTEGNNLKYYATPGVATVLKNHLGAGWEAGAGKNIYHAFRTWADTSVSLQLAVNAFHFTFSMGDAQWNTGSLALAELQDGHVGKAAYNMVKAMVPGWSQADMFMDGSKLRKAMLNGDIPPELKDESEAVLMGGGRLGMGEYRIDSLHNNAEHAIRQAWRSAVKGEYGDAAFNAASGLVKGPIYLAELINKPLMEEWIPRMKLGAFTQLASYERAKGPDNLRERYQKAWQVVDDRLGQLATDNLFWKKSATQTLRVGTRSLTWNYGTKNVAMGAFDPLKTIATLGKGRIEPLSIRTNYIIAGVMLTAWNSVMMQYLLGQGGPKKLDNPKDEFIPGLPYSTDLFMPRIGGTDRYGKPKRIMLASYIKDFAEYIRIMGGTGDAMSFAASKVNPGLSLPMEAARNKDEMGNQIGTPLDRLKHIVATPIGASQVIKGRQEGKPWIEALAPAMGAPPPRADLVSTRAENVLREKLRLRRSGATAQEFEEAMKLSRLATAKHAGNEERVQEALNEGEIGQGQMKRINKGSRERGYMNVNVKNRDLRFNDLSDVYEATTSPEERRIIFPELVKRYNKEIGTSNPKMKEEMKARFSKFKEIRGKDNQ